MIGFMEALPQDDQFKNKFGFLVAHVIARHSSRYTETLDSVRQCISNVRRHLEYAQKHTILCILHPRDYTAKDWRSISVGSLIHADLMSVPAVHYLTQVTLWDSGRAKYHGRSRLDGVVRPFFPFRSTMEASFYLVNRDVNGVYEKWETDVNMMLSIKRTNVWRTELVMDSFTPSLASYKTILELFCHPDKVILDISPHTGGFASAAELLKLDYVGICDQQQKLKIKRRIQNIRESKANEIIARILAPSNRVSRISKTSRVFGGGRGLRKD